MGISGLGPFVRNRMKVDCGFSQPLSDFSGTSWGVDALNKICIFKPIVVKNIMNRRKNVLDEPSPEEITNNIKKEIMKFNTKLLDHHITPVWIWDGESDESKSQTKVERRQKMAQAKKKHLVLREKMRSKNILELTSEEINEWKKSVSLNHDFPPKQFEVIKEFLIKIGIPTITAEDEGENLAASLSYEEKISMVVSNDTDTYPLAARKVFGRFYKRGDTHYVEGTEPWKIPKSLGLKWRQFRDLCILFGTDFNKNLPGIGTVKSYDLIQKFGSLENIEKNTKHNLTFMEYTKRRKQLAPYSTYYQMDSHLSITDTFDEQQIEMFQEEYPEIDFIDFFGALHNVVEQRVRKKMLRSPSLYD